METSGLDEIVRIGIVSSVDIKNCTARVTFPDRDDDVSYDLPVIVRNTKTSKDYWLPEETEQVLCLFLNNGDEQGFILGSYYSDKDKPPPQAWKRKQRRPGIWFDEKNFIEWVPEEKEFIIRSEKPIRYIVGSDMPDYEDDLDPGNWRAPYDPHEE